MKNQQIPTAPGSAAKTETATVAATASAAIATGVGDGSDWVLNVYSSGVFNIAFSINGTNTITDPANTSCFPAGKNQFRLCKQNSHFKVTAAANGFVTTWLNRA